MTHLKRDVLGRYLIQTSPMEEKETVDWHLENCPECREEFCVRDIIEIAKEARDRLVAAIRAAERN